MSCSRVRGAPAVLAVLLLLAPLAGCGAGGGGTGGSSGRLEVLAAASLIDTFDALARDFEKDHDGSQVSATYGSSTDLAEQAADGAPGDVLATADKEAMDIARKAGAVEGEPVLFARNHLVIVTAPGNPEEVHSLADLADLTWVRCADDVPCGRVALALLERQPVDSEPASLEVDVKSTLEKVTAGEADAGLVYASDAVSAGDEVGTVEIDGAERESNDYYIAPLSAADDPRAARAWVDLVTSEDGQRALERAGFTVP